ncbi:hypothetical protein K438DRAFT_1988017 [Mycena galopus ATCC 62051]|nr:hypothetical protein K438DRAFT_1988017 [Mycena galopus ATCC 62051]
MHADTLMNACACPRQLPSAGRTLSSPPGFASGREIQDLRSTPPPSSAVPHSPTASYSPRSARTAPSLPRFWNYLSRPALDDAVPAVHSTASGASGTQHEVRPPPPTAHISPGTSCCRAHERRRRSRTVALSVQEEGRLRVRSSLLEARG